jgi:hypothetical protein
MIFESFARMKRLTQYHAHVFQVLCVHAIPLVPYGGFEVEHRPLEASLLDAHRCACCVVHDAS